MKMRLWKCSKECLFSLILATAVQLQGSNISGYVADNSSGETIIGVNVIVLDTDFGSVTDVNGFFSITNLFAESYTLRFSHIAYALFDTIIILNGTDQFLGTVNIEPAVIETETIEVTGSVSNLIEKDTDIASFEINPMVLREVPQLDRDVFKLITFSPSVSISDPVSPQYSVRGSEPGENLIQLDGMTIYNPQHTFSAAAIFNPYAIKNVELLVGGFDASHGGRNSSILYLTSREGHKSKIRGEFQPSISGIVGAIEFPVKYGGTAMFSGRINSDLVSRVMMGMPNLMADFNGAYQRQWGRSKLRFSTFYAQDFVDYSFNNISVYFKEDQFRSFNSGFLTKTKNMANGVQYRSILTPSLIFNSQIYYSQSDITNRTFFELVDSTTYDVIIALDYATRVESSIGDLTLKANLVYHTLFNQALEFGLEQNRYRFFNRSGLNNEGSSEYDSNINLTAFYIQDKFQLDKFIFKAGVRSVLIGSGQNFRLEPRASIVLRLGSMNIKAAAGQYNQYITALNTQDFEMSQFLDYYYPITDIDPISARHYVIGIEGKIIPTIDYGITAYYKGLDRLYRLDYINTLESVLNYSALLEPGTGKAFGLEFTLSGKYGRLSGWGSYTLSKSTRSFPSMQNGAEYLADSDQTHSLKALLVYGITKDITASATLKIASGTPHTWETSHVSHYSYYNPSDNTYGFWSVPITPTKNNVRYPPRINLDIGWKKRLRSGFGYHLAQYLGTDQAYFTMAIQNLLFLHRNPFMYFQIPGKGYYGLDYQMFPVINAGYSIKF